MDTKISLDTKALFGQLEATEGIGVIAGDFAGNLTGANDAFLAMVGYTRAELRAGQVRWDEMTPSEYAPLDAAAIAQCRTSGVCAPYEKEYIRKDGTRLPIQVGIVLYEKARDAFVCFIMDRTEQRRAEEQKQTELDRLQDVQDRLEAGRTATWSWDIVRDRVVADANLARLFSVSPEDAAGGRLAVYLRAIHPDDRSRVREAIETAIASRETYEAEYRVVLPDGSQRWLVTRGRVDRDASGQAVTLPGIVLDVTERIEHRRRERFLAGLAERARGLTDPDEVIANAVASLGEFLGVSRCLFADIDAVSDVATVLPDFRADEGVASMAGVFPLAAFDAFVGTEYRAGRTVVVDDTRTDTVRVPPASLPAYEAFGIRAHASVPVVHSSHLVSLIAVHSRTPRNWTPEDVALIQAVVERTWLTVQVTRQQQALAREAEELREAHEHTARILESITDAFLSLDTDWRFTYLNDQAQGLLQRPREDLLGSSVWEEFPAAVGTAFETQYHRAMDTQNAVTFEEYYPPLGTWFEVRAYPSRDGLSVFFQDINARKAMETARERLAERERNIAQHLQAALTPTVPERVPGMALNKHYAAALSEAEVGGDFYDVFLLRADCTALTVGDLSGKGLAAASQVATVRSMLRYALYQADTLGEAVTGLNALLIGQRLITGFATLFVGCYDRAAGTLTYVNCGQEAGLIRRSDTGEVTMLPPTGPVLGSFERAVYEEKTVPLGVGDALAIFTDGLTEAGAMHAEILGIEGVSALLAGAALPEPADSPEAVARFLSQTLIAGADTAAVGGPMHDDVCLLIGVVEAADCQPASITTPAPPPGRG